MFELEICYTHTGYKPETYHPVELKYCEVVDVMTTIVAMEFCTTNIKWLDIFHNMFAIWIDNECKGYAIITKVGPKTSEPDLESG